MSPSPKTLFIWFWSNINSNAMLSTTKALEDKRQWRQSCNAPKVLIQQASYTNVLLHMHQRIFDTITYNQVLMIYNLMLSACFIICIGATWLIKVKQSYGVMTPIQISKININRLYLLLGIIVIVSTTFRFIP